MKTTMERLIADNYQKADEVVHIIRGVNFKKFPDVKFLVNKLCPDVRIEKNKIEIWNDSKLQWEAATIA